MNSYITFVDNNSKISYIDKDGDTIKLTKEQAKTLEYELTKQKLQAAEKEIERLKAELGKLTPKYPGVRFYGDAYLGLWAFFEYNNPNYFLSINSRTVVKALNDEKSTKKLHKQLTEREAEVLFNFLIGQFQGSFKKFATGKIMV
jgi:hypothetical protein